MSFPIREELSSSVLSRHVASRFSQIRGIINKVESSYYSRQRRRLAAGLVFEKRPAQLQSPVLKIEPKNYSELSFIKVALRPLLIKDLMPIATTSSQPSSKPHVSGCFSNCLIESENSHFCRTLFYSFHPMGICHQLNLLTSRFVS